MNVKMVAGILVVCAVASIFFVAPIQAHFNRTANGDILQTQDREQLRTQNRNCTGDCTQTQNRQRAEECFRNRTCTETINMEQFRNQHREGR